jgi:HK97 gp10 family phage protein
MTDRMQVRVEGAAELSAALGKLSFEMQRSMFRSALRDGAKVTLARIIANAPVRDEPGVKRSTKSSKAVARGPGYLKRHIAIKSLRSRNRRQTAPEVGIVLTDDAWYGRAVESGHAPPGKRNRQRYLSRARRGGSMLATALGRAMYAREVGSRSTPPRPFIRPAVRATGPAAIQATADALRKRLARWSAATLKKAGVA